MANITLQEMYDEWKKAANGIGTPSDSAQPDPTQAATIIAALKGQLERLGDLLEQMQGNGTGAMPVQLTGSFVKNGYIDINPTIGTIPAGSSKSYYLDLTAIDMPVEAISIIGRNDSGVPIKIEKRDGYLTGNNWQYTVSIQEEMLAASNSVGIQTERFKVKSQRAQIVVTNTGASDVTLTALNVLLWRSLDLSNNGKPVIAQLTGNKVLLDSVAGVTVTAGSSITRPTLTTTDYSKIVFAYRLSVSSNHRAELQNIVATATVARTVDNKGEPAINGVFSLEPVTGRTIARMYNTGGSDFTIVNAEIWGVK